MKLYNIFLYAFLSIGIFTSCEKDLDIKLEDDDDLLANDVFNTRDDYRSALGGVYANLSLIGLDVNADGRPDTANLEGIDDGTSQYIRGLFSMQNVSTDEVIWSYENDPGIRDIQRNSWDDNNVFVLSFFSRASFQISLANEFLRQTTDGKLDSRGVSADLKSEIQTFRAEARVLRALSYYHLLDLYGRAPFATENDAVGFTRVPEIKGEALFNYIEEELLAVESQLLDVNPGQNYARVNKGVAKMILAKIYLNAEVYLGKGKDRYTDCLQVCQEIINSGYSLNPNYLNNFNADNDTNGAQNEIIFPVVGDGSSVRNFGGASLIIQGEQNAAGFEPTPASLGVEGFTTLYRARKQFSEKFVSNLLFVNDSRNTLVTQDVSTDPTVATVDRPIEIGTDFTDFSKGYLVTKYSNIKSTGQPGSNVTFADTDFPMFRLADVYLMYAEAHLKNGGGDRAAALGYINALRERAFGNPSGNITDTELTLDFILDERSRELYWEAHRRQDLIRHDKYTGGAYNWRYKGGTPNGSAISDNFKLFPVPASSRAANPNLGQNPGF
ncbi:RagB/SusD family nutrient uptake outer membrane protein [Aquimarina muelleri]|uniref:Membrane protein n=1 Tax=Aquimarina muelleri TaxID=279356 RepID=A0A918JXF8_9FLAO|nr:RagB/SusD family nutrient uptake outer membrane protein [Aquimarina muelleri]MCX2763260.1 RagB/SusD family nutrient uptake outer membrane protein [Aquimarina muelleri]GGX27605.1 membrane protein [Aquimarina muelleri]